MICRNIITNKDYNYSFMENDKVLLDDKTEKFSISYEEWVDNYYVKDKWKRL